MSMAVDDLLDVEAAADYVGCSIWTIRYRIQRLGLAPSRIMGQAKFFTAETLDEHFREKPLGHSRRR